MRIVHVTPFYYPIIGGGQTHIKELSERLARRGHDVTVFTRNCSDGHGSWDRPSLPDTEIINRVKVRRFTSLRLPAKLLRVRGSGLLLRTINSDFLNMWARGPHMPRLIAEIIRSEPDVVAVLSWFLPAIPYHARLAKMFKRFAFVGIPLFHTEAKWPFQGVYPKILRHCDAVLVNTAHEGRFVNSLVPGKREVHVVGVGVSPAEFAEPKGKRIRDRYGLGDLPVVGYVGKRIPQKGVGKLAQAMKIVWKSDERVRLVLAGPFGESEPIRRREETLLGDLSTEERSRIIQIGTFTDEDKPSIFDAFDIFAMPSTAESFGITYLEAWMCRKPVIGSRIGATQCVIREGVDGLLVDPHDPADLAAAILELLRDPEKRTCMGQAGYLKTLTQFTWEKITDKVESVYSQISGVGDASWQAIPTPEEKSIS
jgi:glycosyltransferase involved in cell wall biosynthesis